MPGPGRPTGQIELTTEERESGLSPKSSGLGWGLGGKRDEHLAERSRRFG